MKKLFIFLFVLSCVHPFLFSENQPINKVYVGVYLSDISNFNLSDGRFNADIIVWCKWAGKNIAPPIQFANAEITVKEELFFESDNNWNSIKWHIQGTFRGTFPLQDFPFDKQKLKLQFDLPKEFGVIVPDLAGSGMAEQFSITGWSYEPFFKTELKEQTYYSDFGSITNEGTPFEVNTVTYLLDLTRPIISYIVKFLLPLLIIIIISMISFFLSPAHIESNLSIGITTLLTCVALHFALSDSVPNVSYLVATDKLFIAAYIIIVINIIESVITYKISLTNMDFAVRIDKIAWKVITAFIVLGLFSLFFSIYFEPGKKQMVPFDYKINAAKSTTKDTVTYSIVALNKLNTSNILHGLVYRGLYHKTENNEKIPHLVVKIPELTNEFIRFLQNGGVMVRWQLKPGLKWGDGIPITAEDLIFSLGIEPDKNIVTINKLDELTIEIEYKKRTGSITDNFTVYPKHTFNEVFTAKGSDGVDELLTMNPPPMDGPYILEKFEKGKFAQFKVNPYFYGNKPLINTIIIKAFEKKDDYSDFENNETDICGNLSVATYNKLKNLPDYATRVDKAEIIYLLQPDLNIKPYSELNFRKALMHGLNRSESARILFDAEGYIADSYRPQNSLDYNNIVNKYEYNITKARELLKTSYRQEKIRLIVTESILKSPSVKAVEEVLADLKNLGLNAVLETTDKSTAKLYSEQNHGGLLFINKESNFEGITYFWQKKAMTDEISLFSEKFDATLFEERKIELSKKSQELYSEILPTIPLTFGVYRSIYHKNLVGWDPKKVTNNLWWNVEYWYYE